MSPMGLFLQIYHLINNVSDDHIGLKLQLSSDKLKWAVIRLRTTRLDYMERAMFSKAKSYIIANAVWHS